MFEGETAKGVLLLSVVKGVGEDKKQQLEKEFGKLDFLPFKDYPHEEYQRLIDKAASLLAANRADGVRILGKNVYLAVKDTLTVKTLRITMRINDFESMVVKGLPLAYEKFTNYARATVEKTGDDEYIVTIKDSVLAQAPYIVDYHRGIIEGVAEAEGVKVETSVLQIGSNSAKIKIKVKK